MATDPVCGMYVDPRTTTLKLERENRTYYFCAVSCLETFSRPEQHRARLVRQLAVAWPLAILVAGLTYLAPFPSWPYAALVLAGVVQVYAGRPFYRGAYDAVRNRVGNMDLLIAVATTAAFAYSAAVVLLPGRLPPSVYFDASSLILALILTGNFLEQRSHARSSAVVRALRDLVPAEVVRVGATGDERLALDLVSTGDRLRVGPHERVPADGVVRSGRSWTDDAIVTGESGPVAKQPGDAVVAGSRNGDGVLEVEVTAVGSESFLGTIGRLVTEAESSRMPLRRLADRVASWFAPIVLAAAAAAALGWGLLGGASLGTAILVFVSVAITACPCAFGIATPAAISVGVGRAAESGILFRGEESLERTATVEWVVSDKTGTLTEGRPHVARVLATEGGSTEVIVQLAAGLSKGSSHPFGAAVTAESARRGLAASAAGELRVEAGVGSRGEIGGRSAFFGRLPPDAATSDPFVAAAYRSADEQGESISFVSLDGRPIGAITFVDPVAGGVRDAVAALLARGVTVELATGDRAAPARSAAESVGISRWSAELSPAQKSALVARRRSEGHVVAFVGDGVNDAPALMAADVGIAIGTGTEVAREAGGVLLLRDDFAAVPSAIDVARATVAKVRQNLLWAIGYNAVLLPVAAGALVPFWGFGVYAVLPFVGALAMAFSSTSVVTNSLSLRRLRLGPSVFRVTAGSPSA